jgi:phage terminase large subunit
MNDVIEFDSDLFNDLYYHLDDDFNNNDIRFIFAYGGSSASKTYTVVQLLIIRMLSINENTMILRKYGCDIKDSIYSDFQKIITEWDLNHLFKFQINYIECLNTGSYIRFRGLDDAEKIKGLVGFKRVVLEEISQFDEEDLKQIRKRLRGEKGQQIVGLFNPISEDHWLKKLFDSENLTEIQTNTNITSKHANNNFVVYKVTYLNNHFIVGPQFIDKHTIADFEKDKITDFNYYQIYGLGNWGRLRTGGEFWKNFNTNKHISDIAYNPNLPIHLVFDENVNPYITCLVWQIAGKQAYQIDEICLEDPRNTRKHVCNEFIARYPTTQGLFIYGDKTSWKADTGKEKGENFFTDILGYLRDYKPSLRLQSVNPSIVKSGGFVNQIFAESIDNLSISINPKCKKSINDYTYALEDSDGTIKKTKVKNKITGVTFEEFGHQSDALRYIMTVAFASEYQDYLNGGRKINFKTISIKSKNKF